MGEPREHILGQKSVAKSWNPLPIDFLFDRYSMKDRQMQFLILVWGLLCITSIASVWLLSPDDTFMGSTGIEVLYSFFIMFPPLFLGTLLLFWLGFEWGSIPVFLSAFLIAYSSSMAIHWSLLFAGAFVLGLAIFALCYHSISISPQLTSLKEIAFFAVVAFIAALASSLGSFVWSLYHDLSAYQTLTIWRGWWTGTFLQSILIVGPTLYFLTPSVERVKAHFFKVPKSEVTLQWIYAAITSVVLVLTLFIIGANVLGSMGMQEELAKRPAGFGQNIMKATESFKIITWISIGLVMVTGMGGIYLVGSWNRNLKKRVEEQTKRLRENEEALQEALAQRDELINKVNYRVKDNFTMVLALLELQLKTGDRKSVKDTLKDSHARLRSLALVYETMHQSDAIDYLNLKQYCLKLSNRLSQSYKRPGRSIEVQVQAEDLEIQIERAVPVAMILNELLVNAYVHGFKEGRGGTIFIEITEKKGLLSLTVRDNGRGLPKDFNPAEQKSLGMKLVLTLTRQLQGRFDVDQSETSGFILTAPLQSPPAAADRI